MDGRALAEETKSTLRLTFSKKHRLRGDRTFHRVFERGERRRVPDLTVIVLKNDCGYARLGISVPKRVGDAVVRNRIKRQLREAFRAVQHELPAVDIVLIPRREFHVSELNIIELVRLKPTGNDR
jgi:ribonuclease P protein component